MDNSYSNKQNIVSDNKGITLIELLIGIAIMGIVSSMISVIMVGGTNFFRKQSATIDLQNDSQLITASMSSAILEGTGFTLQEKHIDGRTVLLFTTGAPLAEGESGATPRQYIWVEESPFGDKGYLYIYDAGATVDYNKGNCISEVVTYLDISAKAVKTVTDASGEVTYTYDKVKSASKVDSICVSFTLANSKDEVTQNIEIRPRNTSAGYEKYDAE